MVLFGQDYQTRTTLEGLGRISGLGFLGLGYEALGLRFPGLGCRVLSSGLRLSEI